MSPEYLERMADLRRADAALRGEEDETATGAPVSDKTRAALADLLDRLAGGDRRTSIEQSRLGPKSVLVTGERSLLARNLLNVLRASSALALREMQEGSIGTRLRGIEMRDSPRRRRAAQNGQLDLFEFEAASTPLCDEIENLLQREEVQVLDDVRRKALSEIEARHARVIVLSERIGALENLASMGGPDRVGYLCASGPALAGSTPSSAESDKAPNVVRIPTGQKLEKLFRKGGTAPARATAFLSYAMAEGINLQSADALVLLGVTSNLTQLVQGLGRIDRIDTDHEQIHYHPLDVPTRPLASDHKAVSRIGWRDRLAGTPAPAPNLPDRDALLGVARSLQTPRVLRDNNFHDRLATIRQTLSKDTFREVEAARPEGLWGARIALTAPGPVALLNLRGCEEVGRFGPPRLLALGSDGTVIRNQIDCAHHLQDSWDRTQKAGLHRSITDRQALAKALGRLQEMMARLREWDLRPERSISLLDALAGVIDPDRQGAEALFGDLPLTSIEILAEAFSDALAPYWRAEKEHIARTIPDGTGYLSIAALVARLEQEPEVHASVRSRMEALLAEMRLETSATDRHRRPIAERISVAFVPVEVT